MRTTLSGLIGLVLAVGMTAVPASAVDFHAYYGDHMVLQRDKPAVVRGAADAGATVTVSFGKQSKTAKAGTDGVWSVTLDAMPADAKGKPLVAKAGGKSATLTDVVVGDVILYARQASVDVTLGSTAEGERVATAYKANPNFRTIGIHTIAAKQPREDLAADATTGWSVVDAAGAAKMSAAAFYLGRDLTNDLDVPVGIVDLNMGVYFAIGWLSDGAIEASITALGDKELRWQKDDFIKAANARDDGTAQRELDEYYDQQVEAAKSRGRTPGPKPSLGIHPIDNPQYPSGGFNAVIHPLRHVAFRGVVLQHGADYPYIPYRRLAKLGLAQTKPELDMAWQQNYMIMKIGYRSTQKTMPHLIGDWRKAFGDKSLPIGLVAPPSSDLDALAKHHREMRELHRRMAADNPNVGLILPGMDNVDFSGQPADEKLLAQRVRLWVLADVCGKRNVVASGPQFDHLDAYLANATVYFKPGTADGLKATGDVLSTFEAAAPGGEFFPATARIEGDTIKLHCPDAGQIEYVRFNWQNVPDPGLVNAAGLPALPFNTDDRWTFGWITAHKEEVLPVEYQTTADQWGDNDVAIINGEIDYLEEGDSEPIPRRPGPIGIYSSPFGPNIYVISIDPGTPAVGKLMPGDLIFGVNGEKFAEAGDPMYKQLSAAITHSESEAGDGKLVCMIRRGKKIMNVTLQLRVLGTYSPTSPYYCQKTENLINLAEQWVIDRCRPESGPAANPYGMLGTDIWFLLATGDPKVQGLVRRAVYAKMCSMTPLSEPDPYKPAHNWHIGYDAVLFGEYYHATGDRNVLPYLKNLADWAAVTQIKAPTDKEVPWEVAQTDEQVGGYRQRYNPQGKDRWKSGYGLMPPAGIPCVMGMIYAKEAGLAVDEQAYKDGIRHVRYQRAEHAHVEYLYSNMRTDTPAALNPEAEANGQLWSQNGKISTAAAMFRLLDDHQVVEICSRYSVYAYNKTRYGHGGMYFNNLWTPIGAHAAGPAGFRHFMQGQQWWRELYRRSDGSYNQVGRGGVGVSYAIHYAAPRKRLRIFGAPRTAFATGAPQYLQVALLAHENRDYAECEKLILKAMDEIAIPPAEQPMVDHFLESVRILRASIDYDLTYAEQQIAKGNYDYAAMELPQLRGVVSPDNERLKAIVAALDTDAAKAALPRLAGQRKAEAEAKQAALQAKLPPKPRETWACLTPDRGNGGDGPTVWKMKLVEDRVQSPDGWAKPGFDDSGWDDATMPISWAMYHTVLFRGKFNVADKSKIDKLRFRGGFFQQGNVLIYINGELAAKVDNIGRGAGMSDGLLTDYAVELLKNGENTVAVTTRHKRRWGPLRGKYTSAEGFTFMLDARQKQ